MRIETQELPVRLMTFFNVPASEWKERKDNEENPKRNDFGDITYGTDKLEPFSMDKDGQLQKERNFYFNVAKPVSLEPGKAYRFIGTQDRPIVVNHYVINGQLMVVVSAQSLAPIHSANSEQK